jgi:hypothetical protein
VEEVLGLDRPYAIGMLRLNLSFEISAGAFVLRIIENFFCRTRFNHELLFEVIDRLILCCASPHSPQLGMEFFSKAFSIRKRSSSRSSACDFNGLPIGL